MRFAIKRGAWRPLLALLGGTKRRSYVELTDEELTLSFGFLEETMPRSHVVQAREARWPVWGGVGWRMGPGTLGLIGALSGIVELELEPPHRTRVLWIPLDYHRVFISLEEPAAFLRALAQG